ncbi:MAG: hypothetical protein AAGB02_03780 [Pseudomonadota bacterium]
MTEQTGEEGPRVSDSRQTSDADPAEAPRDQGPHYIPELDPDNPDREEPSDAVSLFLFWTGFAVTYGLAAPIVWQTLGPGLGIATGIAGALHLALLLAARAGKLFGLTTTSMQTYLIISIAGSVLLLTAGIVTFAASAPGWGLALMIWAGLFLAPLALWVLVS